MPAHCRDDPSNPSIFKIAACASNRHAVLVRSAPSDWHSRSPLQPVFQSTNPLAMIRAQTPLVYCTKVLSTGRCYGCPRLCPACRGTTLVFASPRPRPGTRDATRRSSLRRFSNNPIARIRARRPARSFRIQVAKSARVFPIMKRSAFSATSIMCRTLHQILRLHTALEQCGPPRRKSHGSSLEPCADRSSSVAKPKVHLLAPSNLNDLRIICGSRCLANR
jgi:hypothetical protein